MQPAAFLADLLQRVVGLGQVVLQLRVLGLEQAQAGAGRREPARGREFLLGVGVGDGQVRPGQVVRQPLHVQALPG